MKKFMVMAALILAVIGVTGVYGELEIVYHEGSDYVWFDCGTFIHNGYFPSERGGYQHPEYRGNLWFGIEQKFFKEELSNIVLNLKTIETVISSYHSLFPDSFPLTVPDKEVSYTGRGGSTVGGFLLKSNGIHIEKEIGKSIESILGCKNKVIVQIRCMTYSQYEQVVQKWGYYPDALNKDSVDYEQVLEKWGLYQTDGIQDYIDWHNNYWPEYWENYVNGGYEP